MPQPYRRVACVCQNPLCNKVFHRKPSEIAKGAYKYCSYTCKGLGTRIPYQERFWLYVQKTETCWLWTGASLTAGYGVLGVSGRSTANTLAHHVSWEIHHGAIPEAMQILHTCDNPPCVNPAHLFLGTDQENSDDKLSKQRQARGETQGNSKLTPTLVYEIRSLKGHMTPTLTAKKYKISKVTVWRIWQRLIWGHLPEISQQSPLL